MNENDGDMLMQKEGLRAARQVDGLTIMNPETGAYYALSETAAFIWERLHCLTSISAVKESTAAKYGVSLQVVSAQIDAFIAEMAAEGLVNVANSDKTEG